MFLSIQQNFAEYFAIKLPTSYNFDSHYTTSSRSSTIALL